MWKFLRGKKSYLIGAAGLVTQVLTTAGVIPPPIRDIILGLLGPTAVITLRAGMRAEAEKAAGIVALPK